MLSAFVPTGTALEQKVVEGGAPVPESAIWIDLVNPSKIGTKAAAYYRFTIPANESRTVRLRMQSLGSARGPRAAVGRSPTDNFLNVSTATASKKQRMLPWS